VFGSNNKDEHVPRCTLVLHSFQQPLQHPPFSSKQCSLWLNSSIFVSSDQRTFLQKLRSLSHVQLQTVVWRFCSSGFFLAERPFRLCRYRTRFTVDILLYLHLHKVVLGLICTFRTKVRSSLGDRVRLLPERYDGCVVPWCLHLHTIVCTDERVTRSLYGGDQGAA
jgi:hypothetical protein